MMYREDVLPDPVDEDELEPEHVTYQRREEITQARDTAERVQNEVYAAQTELDRLLVQTWSPEDDESEEEAREILSHLQAMAEYAAVVFSLAESILVRQP